MCPNGGASGSRQALRGRTGYGEQVEDQGQRPCSQRDGVAGHAVALCAAQRAAPARAALRLRSGAVRRVLGAFGRQGDSLLRDAGGRGQRQGDHDARGPAGPVGEGARHRGREPGAASLAAGVDRRAGAALRLLPERNDDPGRRSALDDEEPDRGSDPHRDERPSLPLWHLSAHPDGDQAGRFGDGEGRQVTMTGLLHEKEFSRKSFLKGGGAMLVGFSVLGAGVGAKAAKAAGDDPFASNGPYDQTAVDSWLIVHSDNTASLKIGKVEMGQGTPTALLIIAAEELNMDFKQMKMISHDTNVTPNQGASVGSQGVQTGGKQTRAAAAAAYHALLNMASANLGVPVSSLSVKSGVVSGGGKTVTYGQLIGDKLFNTSITGFNVPGNATTPARAVAGGPNTKPVSQYTMVGKSGVTGRVDIPDKVTGRYTFVHNIKIPGMLHARLVRPRGQGAYGAGTNVQILSVDESSIKKIPGAQVVRSGNFLAVVAEKEYDAIQAAAQLKVKWGDMPTIRPVGNLFKGMRDDDAAGKAPARIVGSSGNFDAAFASAAKTLQRAYKYHYTGHLPIGPSCCVADVTSDGARIFSNSQDLYTTRGLIADALKAVGKHLPANRLRLTYVEC